MSEDIKKKEAAKATSNTSAVVPWHGYQPVPLPTVHSLADKEAGRGNYAALFRLPVLFIAVFAVTTLPLEL